ncbi:MAG: oxidoreductase [Chloroflexi bacterium]|nr:oxidoreductase [Chloroflexota bacterium]
MTLLSLAILIPWAAGIALVAVDGRRPVVGWAAVATLGGTLVALVALGAEVLTHGEVVVTTGGWPRGVGITLRADAAGVLFAVLSVGVLLAATAHLVMGGVRERTFPGIVVLLAAGLTGLFLTGDLFNFYVFFELAMLASYVLATYGGSRRSLGSALVFTLVNLLGTFVFLLSVAGIYHVTGTLDMAAIGARMDAVDPNAGILIAVGFFVAFSVKLGLFPFHFWLPTVYTGARPAVAAILAGGLANVGAYGLLRFGGELLPRELDLAAGALVVIGAASVLYGGVLAISRHNGSEMLAYSAIGQVGYVLVAVGIGGPVGFAAAVMISIVNSLNKVLLFLTTRMRGAIVGWAFLLGALSVAGVPPAVGFVAKMELFRAAADAPALLVLLFLGSAMSLLYAFQIYQYDFWRTERHGPRSHRSQLAVLGIVAAVVLVAGLWPEPLVYLSDAAARAVGGAAVVVGDGTVVSDGLPAVTSAP